MSAKPALSRSWTSAVLERLHELGEPARPRSRSTAAVRMRSRMARASSARRSESCFEVVMTSRWRSLKAARQCSRQASGSPSSSGQVRWSVSSRCDGVEVKRRVEVVPSEHLEGGQVVAVPGLREVGKGDAALVALAVVGDEEQVVGGPGLALGLVGRGALLECHLAENAAQRHHRQALRLELDEEDAPRLARHERAQALDLLDLRRVLRVDPELLRACTRRSAPRSRPSRSASRARRAGRRRAGRSGGCGRGVRGGPLASVQPSFSSIQQRSCGLTPTGASTRFR